MPRDASNRPDMSTLTTLLSGVAFGAVSAGVQLLFSRHQRVQNAAGNAFEKLRAAAAELRGGPGNTEAARPLYNEAQAELGAFTDAASEVLQKPFWRAT